MRSKVEGSDDLVRDEVGQSIINTNKSEYEKAVEAKRRRQQDAERIHKLQADVDEIKMLLKQLLVEKN